MSNPHADKDVQYRRLSPVASRCRPAGFLLLAADVGPAAITRPLDDGRLFAAKSPCQARAMKLPTKSTRSRLLIVRCNQVGAMTFGYAEGAALPAMRASRSPVIGVRADLMMTSLGLLLLLDAAIVGLCQFLPRTHFGRPFRAALTMLGGFVLAQSVLSSAVAGLGILPKGLFDEQVQRQTQNDDGRPIVLVIGSSFSEHGIDPDLFAAELSDAGRPVVVNRLAVGGAPHLERLYYLKQYLARAARKPELVLFEVAGNYDSTPLYQVHQMRFSDRMVAIMDAQSLWWGLRWLGGTDGLGLWQRVRLGGEIFAQWALHLNNIGYLWNSAPIAAALGQEFTELPWTDPVSDQDAPRLLKEADTARDLRPDWPTKIPAPWMSAFLAEEMATLQHYGTRRFAFFSVPSMQGVNVVYARRFCAAMRQFPCFVGEEPELLDALGHGADWWDYDHLKDEGSRIFTRWLADHIVEAGVWP